MNFFDLNEPFYNEEEARQYPPMYQQQQPMQPPYGYPPTTGPMYAHQQIERELQRQGRQIQQLNARVTRLERMFTRQTEDFV